MDRPGTDAPATPFDPPASAETPGTPDDRPADTAAVVTPVGDPDGFTGSDAARAAVIRRTARRVRQYPEIEIGSLEVADAGIDPRDLGLAGAIDHAIARRWLTLEALLAPRCSRGWDRVEGRMQACLMLGAAQLLFLDRVPEHAAIHSSVELARRLIRPGAAGMTNAVLRSLARDRVERLDHFDPESRNQVPLADGTAWRMAEDVFDADPVRRLSAQVSLGPDLVARWYAAFGHAEAQRLALHTLVDAPITVSGIPPLPPRADDERPLLIPHDIEGFQVLDAPRETLDTLLRDHPGARVQDPVSSRPVAATADLRPTRILDACAGRGTKTRQLRALHPDARIVAAEIDADRLKVLRATGRHDPKMTVVGFSELLRMTEPFDLIVLDVPCSNTGVLARRVEAKYRANDEAIARLVDMQRQIIADTVRLLAPGGHLLYATCSLEPAENEQQIAWMTHWHPLDVVSEAQHRPTGLPGDPPTRFTDGGGHALLRARPA
jgi:16S rRNA (cytosine967-C5)-methyltransferase